jgi:hypothetical protein
MLLHSLVPCISIYDSLQSLDSSFTPFTLHPQHQRLAKYYLLLTFLPLSFSIISTPGVAKQILLANSFQGLPRVNMYDGFDHDAVSRVMRDVFNFNPEQMKALTRLFDLPGGWGMSTTVQTTTAVMTLPGPSDVIGLCPKFIYQPLKLA